MSSTEQQTMPSTWNRNVDIDAAGDYLDVSITGSNRPPPPALKSVSPEGQTRNDTALEISVFTKDADEDSVEGTVNRGGGGAKILYHASGREVELTGIEMKNGDSIPDHLDVRVNPPGTLMTLTITKDADEDDWRYYVQGTVNGVGKQTEDPRIHNRPQ